VNPEELTVGVLRRALAGGLPEETIHEALARLGEAAEDAAQHAQKIAAYQTYIKARAERLHTTVVEAVDEVDRKQQHTGYSWSSPEDRAKARHVAGVEAQNSFLDNEPLLEFNAWVEAGEPERYHATTPAARREARIARLLRQGG
jgi:hypothetical protein